MVKIVHIAKPIGGVGVYINLLCKHLKSNSFQNILLCNKEDNLIEIKNVNDSLINIYDVNLKREISIYNDFKCLLNIIKLIRKIQPELIHCHSAKAGILGRIAGAYLNIPTLYTPHAYSYLSAETKIKRILFKKIEKIFKWFPAKTLACSTSEYNRTINDLNFNSKKVLQWNNSIENNFDLVNINLKLPENFICSIGRPSFQKNTQLLIKSIYQIKKTIPNIKLVILGVGHYSPDLKKIEELIHNLDLTDNINLIPWLNRNETISVLNMSLMYISTSRYEGLPYALIEAMALSKACVVTNVDGNKDLVINNLNGFLTQQNSLDVASKTISILKDDGLRKKMEQQSFNLYDQKFNIKKNIIELENKYMKILS
ncbi:glycosyltransferase [Tenacibaculum agarivorans]|uniref:glycosyltransferase n=1 Tax=Tenacibaculum agarivorans TaxID=1908389 RepID=UPI00094BC00B|nr:glycosyltransferase [Tenacibaculum agarivorans]